MTKLITFLALELVLHAQGELPYSSRVSAHLRLRAHPVFLKILWSVCICVIRTNGFSVQTPTPVFWPVNFKRPWAINREITVIVRLIMLGTIEESSECNSVIINDAALCRKLHTIGPF